MLDSPSGSLSQEALDAQLFTCIRLSQTDALAALIEAGANPNAVDEGGLPVLHLAALWHDREATDILLNAGANPHARDGDGNTALHKSVYPDVSIRLMLAGVSPSVLNNELRPPQNEISFHNTSADNYEVLLQTRRLLDDCTRIEKAAERRALTEEFWEQAWPRNASSYPPPKTPVPQILSVQYLLHKAEETGTALSKDYVLSNPGEAAEGLCRYLAKSHSNLLAWKRHCEYQSSPMTMDDWRRSEIAGMISPESAHLLFDKNEIAALPDLKPLYALYEELPQEIRETPDAALEETLSDAIAQWLDKGCGRDMNAKELQQAYHEMPGHIKPLVSFQQEMLSRRYTASSHARNNGR